ncbi:pre-mRNA-processing protein 45, putative [Hepatocystis sp. ex Piliocolobus tephrosceles]|nr:pre-mRNA-processing protein 45, putative [Hepatocystis sp. ex Piliocolobus tephrosceles]
MTDFLRNIPKPKHKSNANIDEDYYETGLNFKPNTSASANAKGEKIKNECYEYLKRKHLRITCNDDFRGGGAYPEIHIFQYPNDMGLKKKNNSSKNLVLKYIDDNNNVRYDNLINEEVHLYNNSIDAIEPNDKINKLRKKKILSQVKDREEKYNEPIYKPDDEEESEIIENTKKSIANVLNEKINKNSLTKKEDKFYRYIPNNKLNDQLDQRIIKVVEKATDPLDVSKFKHKKLPNVKQSPDYPLLRSPTQKITAEEEKQWQMPPCVSNWKNNKGYNIPLDKRVQADYKKLNNIEINDKFAQLSEYLYIAEKKAREEIKIRNSAIKQKKLKEKEQKENILKNLAMKAREEKQNTRSSIINERKREIEREYKIEKNLKKIKNYENRHTEEQIALNKVNAGKHNNIYDISLYNLNNNDSSINNTADDTYQIYDTALFNKQPTNNNIYKFSSNRVKKTLQKTELPTNAQAIKFVKDIADPFGLDSLLSQAKDKK